MTYLRSLEGALLTHSAVPRATPKPSQELAAALDTIPAWATAFTGRETIVAQFRNLPHANIDAQVADLTRAHSAQIVDAVLNGDPMPDPIGEQVAQLRHRAAVAEVERESLRSAAGTLLPQLADILRGSLDQVMPHLNTRLGQIIAQARALGVAPRDIPTGNAALALGEEQRAALLRLEELTNELAEVRRAQADALDVAELTSAHYFANAEELHPWGTDAPWPGDPGRPDAAHLAWVAATPGARAWVPTSAQLTDAQQRVKDANARAEYDHLRETRRRKGAPLSPAQEQRIDQLERIVKNIPAEDMSPSESHRPRPEVAAAQRRRETRARAEAHQPVWR